MLILNFEIVASILMVFLVLTVILLILLFVLRVIFLAGGII